MKKPVISYEQYIKQKKISEALSSQIQEEALNENFLTSVLNFFKGLFDLFKNKELKNTAEESRRDIKEIENDENISNDELPESIDGKKLKKYFDRANKSIENQIDVDKEKGIRVSNELIKKLAGWLGQMITSQDMISTDILQKMLKNTEGVKRLTWVPQKYRQNPRDWYKDKDCILEKSIKEAFIKVLEADEERKEKLLLEFSKRYVEFVSKNLEGGLKKLKENNPDFLDNLFLGFCQMSAGMNSFMNSIMKNSDDEKVAEIVAEKIAKNRKRRNDANPYKKKKEVDKSQSEGTEVPAEKVSDTKKDVTKKVNTVESRHRKNPSKSATKPKVEAPEAEPQNDTTA